MMESPYLNRHHCYETNNITSHLLTLRYMLLQAGFKRQYYHWGYFYFLILDQQLQTLSAGEGASRQHCQLPISLTLHTVATVSLLSYPAVNCHVNTLSNSTDVLQS